MLSDVIGSAESRLFSALRSAGNISSFVHELKVRF